MRYLSRKEVASLLGIKPDSLARYPLPEPDATIGEVRGWREQTILDWHLNRPGQGRKGIPRKVA